MSMQTIQLDISSDIFDKVMSFLEILPKSKIRISKDNSIKKDKSTKESLVDFFQSSPLKELDLERNSEVYHDRIVF